MTESVPTNAGPTNEVSTNGPPQDDRAQDDRKIARGFIVLFFVILALVAGGIALALMLREGPRDYFADPPDAAQRVALIARAEAEMRDTPGDTAEARLSRDVARVVIAIQRHALENEGRLPRTLLEAGIQPGDIEPGIRYTYGSRYWRLFQEYDRVLARGN